MNPCDCSTAWPGILWPWAPNGDDSLPWVERCDECSIYATDDEAAKNLAEILELRVMYAADEYSPIDRWNLRPFVLPYKMNYPDGNSPDWSREIEKMSRRGFESPRRREG